MVAGWRDVFASPREVLVLASSLVSSIDPATIEAVIDGAASL